MNNVTINIEADFKAFAESMSLIMNEAKDIHSAYFATDASTLVEALASGTTGASFDSKLTKAQYQNGIGFLEQINKFFNNEAVTTGDYLNTLNNLIYGNAAVPGNIGDAVESLATRMKNLARSCMTHFVTAKDILETYNNSELGTIVAEITGARIVYGANMSVTQLTQGVTLVEQFKKLINNEAVATGLYSANVAIWKML